MMPERGLRRHRYKRSLCHLIPMLSRAAAERWYPAHQAKLAQDHANPKHNSPPVQLAFRQSIQMLRYTPCLLSEQDVVYSGSTECSHRPISDSAGQLQINLARSFAHAFFQAASLACTCMASRSISHTRP